MDVQLVALIRLMLILVLFFRQTVGEGSFACDKDTVRPENDFPFYKVFGFTMPQGQAQETCREDGAELLTYKRQKMVIFPSLLSHMAWLSARKSNWKHTSLDIGLVADFIPTYTWGCIFFNVNDWVEPTSYELTIESCDIEHNVICMIENIVFCDGYVFDYRCYFYPEDKHLEVSFLQGHLSCRAKAANMVSVYSRKQMQWLVDTFKTSFWTGYQYDPVARYYWPDGSIVSNANWKEDNISPDLDFALIDSSGNWEQGGAEKEALAICTLDVPYAGQRKVTCKTFDKECVCYWESKNMTTFNDAMATCMSAGGTLFYPNNEDKFIFNDDQTYWIGVSQGNTRGVYRGSDSSVIEWAKWISNSYQVESDCVVITKQTFDARSCDLRLPFICQSKPDPELYPCNQSRGCLGAEDFWDIEEFNSVYMGHPEVVIRNVDAFEKCWEICVNYIGFLCLIVTYNKESEECQLFKDKEGYWENEPDNDLLSRYRTRKTEPGSYCLKSMEKKGDYKSAIDTCRNYGLGWTVPVIRDDEMQKNVAEIKKISWLSAEMNVYHVFVTFEDKYIPYSNWSLSQSEVREGDTCVGTKDGSWYTTNCEEQLNIICFAYLKDVCTEFPDITHGTVMSYRNRTIQYTCDEHYIMPLLNVRSYRVDCTCDWYTDLSAVENCTAIECTEPTNSTNGTVIEVTGLRIHDLVTYQCPEGYKVSGTDRIRYSLSCELTSKTTAMWLAVPEFEAIECPEPENCTSGSVVSVTGFKIHDTVLYKCPEGFLVYETHLRFYNRTCGLTSNKTTAVWSECPEIAAIECTEAPDIPNASLLSSSTTVGGMAKYTCEAGYRVVGQTRPETEFDITCLLNSEMESAEWSEQPACEAMLCSEPPPIANGDVTVIGYRLGDTAIYTCKPYYKIHLTDSVGVLGMSKSQTSVCTLDSPDGLAWKPVPTCISEKVQVEEKPLIRKCPTPVKINFATAHYKETFVNSVVTYVTDPGYSFADGSKERSLICLPNGKWGSYRTSLTPKRCPPIDVIGATKSTEDDLPGTLVTITCNDRNARMEIGLSEVTIKCTVLGKWSSNPKSCEVERCGPFPYIERSRLVSVNNTVGGLAALECVEGTTFADGQVKKSFKCLSNLDWEQPGPCLVNKCSRLSVPENSKLSTNTVLVGTVVEVTCLLGFMFPDRNISKRISCEANNQWNVTLPDCETLSCPDPPTSENCFMSKIDTQYNSNITYRCQSPYRTQYGFTEMTIRCQEDARWTYESLTCDSGRCPPVPDVRNAEPDTRLAVHGTTVRYTCDEGHVFSDNKSYMYAYCNGLAWNTTETECTKLKCPHLNLTHASYTEQGNSFGDVVGFSCEEGYQYDNKISGVLKCGANSQWSPSTNGCKPKDCGPPPEMQYSTKSTPMENVYGAVVIYKCLPRYWIKQGVSNTSIVCTKSGEWSNTSGKCKLITCPLIPVWDDLKANTTDNVIGTIVNISCSKVEDGMETSFVIARCALNGTWIPYLNPCKEKNKKLAIFEPKPEEARGSNSIGAIIIAIMVLVFMPIVLSDIPRIARALKSNRPAATGRKKKRLLQLKHRKKKQKRAQIVPADC